MEIALKNATCKCSHTCKSLTANHNTNQKFRILWAQASVAIYTEFYENYKALKQHKTSQTQLAAHLRL